jgi:subtilisin family serine protease
MSVGIPEATEGKWKARPRGRRIAAASLAAFLLLLGASVTVAASQDQVDPEGRYIVVLQDSVQTPGAVGQEHIDRHGGRLGFVYHYGPIGYSATLPASAVEALSRDPRVRDVRVDHIDVAAAQETPTGVERVFAKANKALQIDEKANFTVNADVAVIDTGVDFEHPDLVIAKRTYCDDSGGKAVCTNESGTDLNGHGTHVAGTIAAIDNGVGVVGVAPSARIWPVKVLDPVGSEAEIVAGIQWVTARASEIEVANMSIQCTTLPCKRETIKEAVTESVKAGVVHIGVAGNQGKDAKETEYAKIPLSITVSAIADYDGLPGLKAEELWSPSCDEGGEKQPGDEEAGKDDHYAKFSNYGAEVEITAPGVCIWSTYKAKGYAFNSGTSMAGPHVSGAAAILAAQSNPNDQAAVEAIKKTLVEAGNLNWTDRVGDPKEKLLDLSNETIFK